MSNIIENDIILKDKVPKSRRILAFDLIRGFFLIVIMIDHIELYPDIFDFITGKGRLWVSAAEGFFFLSGLLIGMIYKRRLAFGMRFIFKKMWLRAAELYVVGTALTFLFLAWAEFSHHTTLKDALPNPLPWHHIIEQTLLMRFTYGWSDFLVRFALLMLIAPFVFYLVSKGKWWLAAAGIVIAWCFRGQGFTLSWQLIFNFGIIIGFYWQKIESAFRSLKSRTRRRLKLAVLGTAGLTLFASYMSVYLLSLLFYMWGVDRLPKWGQHIAYDWGNWNHDIWLYADKWTMGPLRIVLFGFWFTALYWAVRRYEDAIARYSRGVLELLGRNSLMVYTIHSFIVFAFRMYVIPGSTNLLQNFLITGAGLTLLVLLTYAFKRYWPSIAGNLRLPMKQQAKKSV
ncbi:MAG TPA: OpgC domain-containing protein [Candidatus Saccharimonadales bacterium]|nr:OpgC domain-containing protein [Candidatus Saccharimonadales bacterium]